MDLSIVSVPYRYDEPHQGLGAGPAALLQGGLPKTIVDHGHTIRETSTAYLDPADREQGRTAVNIGTLGASTAELVSRAFLADSPVLVLTGDDTAAVGVVSGVQQAIGAEARIGVIWLDAHGDFNTPETSYSGILAGMSLSIIAGLSGPNWRRAARMTAPIPTSRIIVAGVRELDEKEEVLIRATDVRVLTTRELIDGSDFERAVEHLAADCDAIVLHLDIDLLDPHLVPSSTTPSEQGLDIDQCARAIRTVLGSGKVVAWTICNVNPGGGRRGERTIQSTISLVDKAIDAWET
ncbi:MAG: arginase family protein [Thermomicrobiales bacterium]|nr:arginase family protein [Thermomicrobiales bacterium]MCO5223644.1 arginase family protein [Thermomicrobiales bacterium]